MLITNENLRNAGVAFSRLFQDAFGAVDAEHERIAITVTSTTSENEYGWLGEIPGMREWIGDRVIKSVSSHDYSIKNKKFELTIGVKRESIEDDNLGMYTPLFQNMGQQAALNPAKLIFGLLKNGFITACYDGQNFFDTDHVVMVDGAETSVSNMQAGAFPAWYLLDTARPIKPLIYQDRIKAELVAKDDPNSSDAAFMRDEFVYGARSRGAAGFGFWQMAHGSKADLTEENFNLAYDAMTALKNDEGEPLGIMPNLLVIPPQLRTKGDEIVKVARKATGADNPNQNIVEVFRSRWLA